MATPLSYSRLCKGLLAGLFAIMTFSSTAHAWWNSEWTIRKKITVDTSSSGSEITDPIGTAAVLLRLHDGNFHFDQGKDDGTDIRFVSADDKTLLPFHIEKFDALLNEAFVWVKLPDVKPGAKATFFLYYGNTGPKAVRADDAKGTFDADTVLVYHFGEHSAPAADSSASSNTAKNAGVAVEGSMIGSGVRFDGKNSITIPSAPSLNWADGANFTWSAWIKPTALGAKQVIFSRRDDKKGFVIGIDNGAPYVEVTDAAGTHTSSTGAAVAVNTWHHLAVISAGTKVTIALDGDSSYSSLPSSIPALDKDATLGGAPAVDGDTNAAPTGFVGELDELDLSKTARPAGFVKFAALSQSGEKADKLIALGEDEQNSSWMSTGYFGIIIKSLTVDGWIVIGILMVMAVISWFVMITKVGYLGEIAKGNARFMEAWHHLANDLTALDHEDDAQAKTLGGRVDKSAQRTMRKSSIFKIYHTGVEEIRHRTVSQGSRSLSALSVAAIRASMDGTLVRETQKLNKLIVFLTLSISGGPFLGLLGTVVGVMITFAAIAAAGDVNVNSIAPGIAAALVATVAGLAVAIPALFGYNYLLSRIKDATSDMHVFIDEFVTKVAEYYSGEPINNGKASAAHLDAGFGHRIQQEPEGDAPKGLQRQ